MEGEAVKIEFSKEVSVSLHPHTNSNCIREVRYDLSSLYTLPVRDHDAVCEKQQSKQIGWGRERSAKAGQVLLQTRSFYGLLELRATCLLAFTAPANEGVVLEIFLASL